MSSVTAGATPSQAGWVGPVLGWEMLRLGRRGSTIWLRALMALLLFAALWAVYLNQFPDDASLKDDTKRAGLLSAFTQTFAYVYLMAQIGVVCLLTPLYVVGAIGEERDRKTLEFLLATDLSNWEIVVGKVGSRMLQLIGLMVTGLPIIALISVWGGVEPVLLLAGYGIALLTMFAVGGMCAACAAIPGSLRAATIRSFVLVLAVYGLVFDLSPFVALRETFRLSNTILGGNPAFLLGAWQFFKWQFLLGSVGCLLAIYWLRRLAFRQSGRKNRPVRSRDSSRPDPRAVSVGTVTGGWQGGEFEETNNEPRKKEKRHWADPPPIQDRPLYWKEVYFSGQMNRFAKLLSLMPTWLWILIGTVLSVMMLTAEESSDMDEVSNTYARVLSLIFLFFTCLTVGLSAAGSVCRERQQQTMIDLLMIPRPRHHLLLAKWFASLKKGFGLACGLVAVLLGAVIIQFALDGGISPWSVLLLLLAIPIYAAFAASLGLFLSVRCSTVLRASCWWLLIVLLWLGGTFLAIEALADSDGRKSNPFASVYDEEILSWDRVINPIYTWNQMAFASVGRSDEYGNPVHRDQDNRWYRLHVLADLLPALMGLALYATLAWLFWWLALASFDREGQL